MIPWAKRLTLPLTCQAAHRHIPFRTETGLLVARGYVRVVIGRRGPYIEFQPEQVDHTAIYMPDTCKWRLTSKMIYYREWHSADRAHIKFYEQVHPVAYADYQPGLWYASPFDLTTEAWASLVRPIGPRHLVAAKPVGGLW